jgi:hypothetical protein
MVQKMLPSLAALFAFLSWFTAPNYGQPSAALWKDQLFVAIKSRVTVAPDALDRGTFHPTRKGVRQPIEYTPAIGYNGISDSHQAKLHLQDERVLLFSAGNSPVIFPLAELPLLEANEFGQQLCKLRGYQNSSFLINHYCGSAKTLLFPPHRKPDVPVPLTPVDMFGNPTPDQIQWQREANYTRKARFDVQIAGPLSLRLLRAEKDTLFISIEHDYMNTWYWEYFDKDGEVIKPLPPPPDRQLRTGKLPAEFIEHFAAYTVGGKDYLVTNNGKVYLCVPKGKTELEVTAIWTDPKQVIAGVVQDQANDAVYGWGIAGEPGSADRFYVKLDPKPVAKTYKLTVPLWKERADAYLESYECARAFQSANEKK